MDTKNRVAAIRPLHAPLTIRLSRHPKQARSVQMQSWQKVEDHRFQPTFLRVQGREATVETHFQDRLGCLEAPLGTPGGSALETAIDATWTRVRNTAAPENPRNTVSWWSNFASLHL